MTPKKKHWIDQVIADTGKELKQLKREQENINPEVKKLMRDLQLADLYIGTVKSKAKVKRAIKSRKRILQRLKELEG